MPSFRFLFFLILWLPVSLAAQPAGKLRSAIPYYPASAGQDAYLPEKCLLDVWVPDSARDLPVVIWFHGGGLSGGKREVPAELRRSGLIAVGPGYRLAPAVRSPVYLEDAAAAIAWVFRHAAEFGGDTTRIFVSGHSAGGYLAAMTGLDTTWLAPWGISANRLAGIIPFSGQMITHFTIRKEQGIPDTQPVIDRYAPLFHIRKDAPPLLLLTGDREKELLGRYEENAYMARMMKLAGHTETTLYELQGYDHGMIYPGFPLLLDFIQHQNRKKK